MVCFKSSRIKSLKFKRLVPKGSKLIKNLNILDLTVICLWSFDGFEYVGAIFSTLIDLQ